MTRDEFKTIAAYLNAIWKDCCNDFPSETMWFWSVKNYSLSDVEAALRQYVSKKKFEPKPADLIELLPQQRSDGRTRPKFQPKFETINGERVQVVQCKRCNDLGLIYLSDKDGCLIGRPCNCDAGKDKFRWYWSTEEERINYNREHGRPLNEFVDEPSFYKDRRT